MLIKGNGKSGGQAGGKVKSLKKTPAEKKLWMSGLPEGTEKGPKLEKMNKDLKKHLSQHGIKCEAAEVWKNGNGSAGFATAKDAKKALDKLNDSTFKGNTLMLDVWEKKEKE